MQKALSTIAFFLLAISLFAQGSVDGRVLQKEGLVPLEYAAVSIHKRGVAKNFKAGMTETDGKFRIAGLPEGAYTAVVTFLGYKTLRRDFAVTRAERHVHLADIVLDADDALLEEAVVVGQRSEMKLEVDRKTFNVEGQIANAGQSASEVLENIPSVEVDNDGNVSLRGNSSVEVWINGKQSGLTSDNQGDILQQLPAESIERIEIIDNPSAKFSAEGSAGIINIVLKKDRKPGYFGSVQVGADTRGGANVSGNINYNSRRLDANFNIGYRHRESRGGSESEQTYGQTGMYQNYATTNSGFGNNLFTRAGLTYHITEKDDLGLSGILMKGGRRNSNITPYHYGMIGAPTDSYLMTRRTRDGGDMLMYNLTLDYRHNFSDTHFIEASASHNRWHNDGNNWYQDSTAYFVPLAPTEYSYQYRPVKMDNRRWEFKLDYENQISEALKLQTGYQANLSREHSPQQSWIDNTSWDGKNVQEETGFYNNFYYKNQIHALYATVTWNFGKVGLMGGLRGEYWHVDTKSYDYDQQHNPALRPAPFQKDYFQLFPSLFASYQITPQDQLQLNYTRRLRRPWGGQLNSFRDTRDATMVRFGNPELTPEFSNNFSLNYLRTWEQHSLLVSAYYRPTTDVMQRISWQSALDGVMYQTTENVSRSTSAGLELTAKNKIGRILDISTNANFYYYKLNAFDFNIDGQTVSGKAEKSFSWNARVQASLILPWDLSFQATGRFRSRQSVAQGYRKANGNLDLGLRKTFLNKTITVSLNVRDLLNTRRFETFTSSDTFTRHQKNWRNSRTFSLTLTYSFGNAKAQKKKKRDDAAGDEDFENAGGYGDSDM